ncbi:sterigmatocystin biosynthesis P450 monooxygenase StcS [Xylariales sp. PMI_506]|nr:sterigmatocystin biosynthesis P450 monooxygenase StcS [Xylariales sp. PMI_506]
MIPTDFNLVLKACLTILTARVAYFLYEGLYWRIKFRRLKAEGVPMLEHSLIYGHLTAIKDIMAKYPKDVNDNRTVGLYVTNNWKDLFPHETRCPSFLCMDVWPISSPICLVWDPDQIHKFTVETPVARMVKDFMGPVTGGRDLLSVDMIAHRLWRARFSSGFSQRSLIASMPSILEEVDIFTNKIRHLAGTDGTWGKTFPLEEPCTTLTLDIIGKLTLGLRLGEQLGGDGTFKKAMFEQITQMQQMSLRTFIQRLNPVWQYQYWRNHRAMDSVIMPQIRKRMEGPEISSTHKTLVDVAIGSRVKAKHNRNREESKSDFIKAIASNVKAFAFAGHDTTASTACWCFHRLRKHPHTLSKLRAEHDEILGPAPRQAPDILFQSPQKINDLPYTLAVIKETLRLHPLVHSPRKGSPSLELTTSNGRVSTKGFIVIVASSTVQQHPDIWYKAEEFIPERWLVPKGDILYPPAHAWRPFEHGPLNCIGQELALIELKLILVYLVREFDIEPDWDGWDILQGYNEGDKTQVDGERAYPANREGGLSKPKDGLPVHIRKMQDPTAS